MKTVEGITELKIPPGTQPGDVLVLSKKGAPKLNRPSMRGDHSFTVKVSIPKRIRCVTVRHQANIEVWTYGHIMIVESITTFCIELFLISTKM